MTRGSRLLIICISIIMLFSSCGNSLEQNETLILPEDTTFQGMCGDQALITYKVPVQLPNTMINQAGYETTGRKKAIFKTEELPVYFYVLDATTRKQVYRGMIEDLQYDSLTKEYISFGDFTELSIPGDYMIYTDLLGESYEFTIQDNQYVNLYQQLLGEFNTSLMETTSLEYQKGSVTKQTEKIGYLFLSYALFPEIFDDNQMEEYSRNGIPDMLDMVRVYIEWVSEADGLLLSGEDHAAFSGLLAHFTQIYSEFDYTYSITCKKRAESEYLAGTEAVKKQEENQPTYAQLFYAAVELYHMTGYGKYHTDVKAFYEDYRELYHDDTYWMLAQCGYITGKRSINLTLCNTIMDGILSEAEEIAKNADLDAYNVCERNPKELLHRMEYLVIVNYVMESNEYRNMIDSSFEYLLGLNPEVTRYIDGAGNQNVEAEDNVIRGDSMEGILFLLLLSEMLGD